MFGSAPDIAVKAHQLGADAVFDKSSSSATFSTASPCRAATVVRYIGRVSAGTVRGAHLWGTRTHRPGK